MKQMPLHQHHMAVLYNHYKHASCYSPPPTPLLLVHRNDQVGRNICHGSDSVENAERELSLWFDEVDIVDHESAMKDWIYE